MKMMRLALGMAAILTADSATTAEIHRNVRDIPESTAADQIEFQVLSDKLHYAPGTLVSVKFIVTNIGETPIYIYRYLGACSSPNGFASLEILDSRNHEANISGCSGDTLATPNNELIKWVNNPSLWILLKPREVYGGIAEFELPAKKGPYRLKAALYPTSLNDQQKEILSENKMTVLRIPHEAPIATVTVR
jgi:hypothetical protein